MFRLTIIIPAHGRQEDLDDTLVSVLENRPKNCEVLVPHPRSYHDPYDLSDEVRFVPTASAGLVELINAGIDASQAPFVHVLRSGIEVTANWTNAALERFDTEVALAALSPRVVSGPGHATSGICGIRYLRGGVKQYLPGSADRDAATTSATTFEGPSLQAAFYRRCALVSIGRLDAHLGEYYCDVDTLVKLRRGGWRCGYEPDSRVMGQLPEAPRGFAAGRQLERLFCRHAAALGPVRSVLEHPWAVGRTLARQFPHPATLTSLLGNLYGLLECLALRRHRWHPEPLQPASPGPSTATIPLETARRPMQTGSQASSIRRAKRRLG